MTRTRQLAHKKDTVKAPAPKIVESKMVKPARSLRRYIGKYHNPTYDTVSISFERDSLYGEFGTEKVLLMHKEGDVFLTRGIDFKEVYFRFNALGKVKDFTIPFETASDNIKLTGKIIL